MNEYVVTVEFRLETSSFAEFLRLVTENARASVETESGCRQFDVIVQDSADAAVFLYEIYDDKPAFDQHLTAAHFIDFDKRSAPMVRSKVVSTGGLHYTGRSPKKEKQQSPKDSP